MAYTKYLKELKERTKLTSAEIATLSNIPMATISRVFNGSTDNPTFETISKIVIAMGGSIDEMIGIKISDEVPMTPQVDHTITAYADLLNEKDKLINAKDARIAELGETVSVLRETIKNERRERRHTLRIFAGFMAGVFVFLLTFVLFDLFNGHFGYFRY